MNYILYLGPDYFRGLIGMPEEPKPEKYGYTGGNWTAWYLSEKSRYYKTAFKKYNEKVESLKANAPKILNPEMICTWVTTDSRSWYFNLKELKPGDIYPLPIGFEFKKELRCLNEHCPNNYTCEGCDDHQPVLRIVKTEPKKNVILGKNSCIHRDGNLQIGQVKTEVKEDLRLGFSKEWLKKYPHLATQPSPEESQKELFRQVVEIFGVEHKKYGRPDYKELESNFTIHRKK